MTEFILNKDMTINHISDIKQAMQKHLSSHNRLTINITKDIEIDFAGIQLLHALKEFGDENSKSISICIDDDRKENNPFAVVDFIEIVSNKNLK